MSADTPDEFFIPIVQERASVSKHDVVTGRVSVSTHVETRQEVVREALRREDVVVDRVFIGRDVDVVPAIRQEGDTIVYPIVEERLVVVKQLFLKEELRVSYKITLEEVTETVDLRSVHADVDRTPVDVAHTPNPQPE